MKEKPTPPFKILSAYWWNPFFWLAALLFPICHGIYQVVVNYIEVYEEVKEYDLS